VRSATLGDLLAPVEKWDPKQASPHTPVEYIDLSAIDQDTKSIAGSRTVQPSTAPTRARQLVAAGDVLVSTVRPALNGVARVPPELDGAVVSTGFSVLRPNGNGLDGGYLFHWVRTPTFVTELVRRATGANYPAVSDQSIRRLIIPLPPLEEQRRVAKMLDEAARLEQRRRNATAQLAVLKQSVFSHLFGSAGTIFSSWPVHPLGDLLEFLTSGSRGWAAYYSEEGSVFLRIQNVHRDELRLDDVAFVQSPDTAEARRTRVKPGDVLLSVTADLGRTAVIPPDIGDAFINQHLAILRTTLVEPRFLSAYLTSGAGRGQIVRLNRQGVKAGLNFDDIRSLRVPCPPRALQEEFARCSHAADRLRSSYARSSAGLRSLFRVLQLRAFRPGVARA
jgi:type I restriction enzyme, S subunit